MLWNNLAKLRCVNIVACLNLFYIHCFLVFSTWTNAIVPPLTTILHIHSQTINQLIQSSSFNQNDKLYKEPKRPLSTAWCVAVKGLWVSLQCRKYYYLIVRDHRPFFWQFLPAFRRKKNDWGADILGKNEGIKEITHCKYFLKDFFCY